MNRNADPVRMCCACRKKKPKSALWRIVLGPDGAFYDPTGKADGRGLYVCRDEACLDRMAHCRNSLKQTGAKNVPAVCAELLRRERP